MTRGQRVIVIVLICAVAGIIAGVTTGEREPHYRGRSLSYWLSSNLRNLIGPMGVLPEENREAIRHIGTNAVPYLLKALKYRQPGWQATLANRFHIRYFMRLQERRIDSLRGVADAFLVLGPQAKGAIPELASMMIGTNVWVCRFSSHALGYIGSDAIPALLDLLTNAPAHWGSNMAYLGGAWSDLGTNAITALPTLLGCLENPDTFVADTSENILDNLRQRKIGIDIMLPGLCKKVFSTNELARGRAARLFRPFQWDPSTLSYLRRAMADSDPQVRAVAGQTVRDFREPEIQHQDASNTVHNAAH